MSGASPIRFAPSPQRMCRSGGNVFDTEATEPYFPRGLMTSMIRMAVRRSTAGAGRDFNLFGKLLTLRNDGAMDGAVSG